MTENKKSSKESIIAEVKKLLKEYSNIENWTLRQMYYRLVAREIIPNNINSYKKLSRDLVWARETHQIDYKKFEDRARKVWGYGDQGCESIEDFIEIRIESFKKEWNYFRYSQWVDQPEYVEVWLEKDALARLFEQVGNRYDIYTCPSRGYSSYSYVMDAVERFIKIDKPITILYFGDYDPTGLNIPEDLISRIQRYSKDLLEYIEPENITLERIALNIDQIKQYNLPPAPAKTSDMRYAKFVLETGSDDVVELDAIDPPELQKIITRAIESHIEADAWNAVIKKTEEGREKLKPMFRNAEIEFGDPDEENEDEEEDEDE